MKIIDMIKVAQCINYCSFRHDCSAFSACIGSRECIDVITAKCDQIQTCRKIKKVVKNILVCEKFELEEND